LEKESPVSNYLKIIEKAKGKKPGSREASVRRSASSNREAPATTKTTEGPGRPDVVEEQAYDKNDQNDKRVGVTCHHEVKGGCWLCRRKIERLVHEGMAPHIARAEVLGYVEEELEL
jgi:hypothetical protein